MTRRLTIVIEPSDIQDRRSGPQTRRMWDRLKISEDNSLLVFVTHPKLNEPALQFSLTDLSMEGAKLRLLDEKQADLFNLISKNDTIVIERLDLNSIQIRNLRATVANTSKRMSHFLHLKFNGLLAADRMGLELYLRSLKISKEKLKLAEKNAEGTGRHWIHSPLAPSS